MSDTRIVIAFAEPPAQLRFTPAKSGKCWTRTVKTREYALELAQKLVDIDIHGVIKKTTAAQEPPKIRAEKARQALQTLERDQTSRAKAALAKARGANS